MMKGKTGLYKGKRCQLCTGCGRCQGVKPVRIVTKRLQRFEVNLQNEWGYRLVTVDLGTTTIAMQLHRIDGSVEDSYLAVNPQYIYGADVISRITAAEASRTREELPPAEHMRSLVLEVLKKGIRRFQEKIAPEEALRMVLAANTTMVYLLMGLNPKELGRAPFHAGHLEAMETVIVEVPCFILPGLSAFVGGDIVSGIHACGIPEAETPRLLVDLGTNGEIVLGNRSQILACATAAGPAFEGGVNRGVWGADMVKLLAAMRRERLMDETGLLREGYFENGVRIGNVCVTQAAVRAVQLAKAAIAAGIRILMEEYGCRSDEIEQVVLAGGFGYYLDARDAAEIGLLPSKLAERTVAGGNTSLSGALWVGEMLLKNGAFDGDTVIPRIDIRNGKSPVVRVINLAEEERFQEYYLAEMSF